MLDDAIQDLLDQWEQSGQTASAEQLCADHPELLEPLKQAIAKLARVDRVLGETSDPQLDDHLPANFPKQIGPYQILELIGRGGMGTVYRAEQIQPIRRIVALKVIKPGFDSQEVIARFESERQALAMMDHPNIAKVLDAGTSDRGYPYFVMEYVPGKPITTFADENKLSIDQRLSLFRQACDAIQHAHTKAILHRDIKPGNVLAYLSDNKPSVKVIDFGIAKALNNDRLTQHSFETLLGRAVGTYEYMSPEQAAGEADIDTRTDVYSLGVLLYELLTGVKPFERGELARAADAEIRRVIRTQEPARPSKRLADLGDSASTVAALRQLPATRLVQQLRRELEWVPLMAIRKERSRRYASVSQMSLDIENYLTNNPLLAGPESSVYRINKWSRRHRGVIAGLLFVVIASAIAAEVYIHGIRAEQAKTNLALKEAVAARQASQTVNHFILEWLRPTRDDRSSGMDFGISPRINDEQIVTLTNEAETNFAGQPMVLSGALDVLALLRPSDSKDRVTLLQRASAVADTAYGKDNPAALDILEDYAAGVAADRTNPSDHEALEQQLYQRLLDGRRNVNGPDDTATLRTQIRVAQLYGKKSEGESLLKDAISRLKVERSPGAQPASNADRYARQQLLVAADTTLFELLAGQNRFDEADVCINALIGSHIGTNYDAANALQSAASAAADTHPQVAEQYYRKAIALFHPYEYTFLDVDFAKLLIRQTRFPEAISILRGQVNAITSESPRRSNWQSELQYAEVPLARILTSQGNFSDATPLNADLYHRWEESNNNFDQVLNEGAVSYGEVLAQQKNTDQAESVFSTIITRLNRDFEPNQQGYSLPQIDPFAIRAMSGLLKIYRDSGRTQAADELLAKMKHWKMNSSVTSRRDHTPPVPEVDYPLLPGSIDATDIDQLKKHLQTNVTVQGQIVDVELTAKKNAINLVLDGEEHTCVLIWISPANFKSLNAAFSGDIGTALLGKVVAVKGTLMPYGGTGAAWAQRLEIPVTQADQIQVLSPSPAQTQPAHATAPGG